MENAPYAVMRIDRHDTGAVRGYVIVCPYYAARQYLHETSPTALQGHRPDSRSKILWDELAALAKDRTTVGLLDSRRSPEIGLICEELADGGAILLEVHTLPLMGESFAPERIDRKMEEWVSAETTGRPLCPFRCRACNHRLEQIGSGTVGSPSEVRKLPYRCRGHETEEAEYDPGSRRWLDLRQP